MQRERRQRRAHGGGCEAAVAIAQRGDVATADRPDEIVVGEREQA
jgi:hypothetical protein